MARSADIYEAGRPLPRSKRGVETRAAILRAALTVFGNRGFTATTMLDIAEEAGVASGTVYQYFKDKADLLSCLLDIVVDEIQRQGRWPADEQGRWEVRGAVLRVHDTYREHAAVWRAWLELLDPPSRFTEVWLSIADRNRVWVADSLRSGKEQGIVRPEVDEEVISVFLNLVVERPAITRLVFGWDESTSDDEVARITSNLVRGDAEG